MKSLKALAVCALLTVSGQSFAKTTTAEIKFIKGGHCGAYSGDIKNKKFDIYLQKKTKSYKSRLVVKNVDDIVVKNSKGHSIKSEWIDDFL